MNDWREPVLNLDGLLAAEQSLRVGAKVIVLQGADNEFAIATDCSFHLESCQFQDVVLLPKMIFGDRYELAAAKQLILKDDAAPVIVLDTDILHRLVRAHSAEAQLQPKAGEPNS